MSEDVVEKIRVLLELGGKISKINDTGSEIDIDIITGLDQTGSELEAIPITWRLPASKELKEFLDCDFVKDAIYNPTVRGIVLIDMVGYSKGDTPVQAFFLTVFKSSIKNTLKPPFLDRANLQLIIPTGDGCYIVFNECLNEKFLSYVFPIFAEFKRIQRLMNEKSGCPVSGSNEIHLRIACELGETDFFYDINKNKNCYGDGMNEAARILSCGQAEVGGRASRDSIFFGEKVANQAERLRHQYSATGHELEITNLGLLHDKHCKSRNVWWMRNLPQQGLHIG